MKALKPLPMTVRRTDTSAVLRVFSLSRLSEVLCLSSGVRMAACPVSLILQTSFYYDRIRCAAIAPETI